MDQQEETRQNQPFSTWKIQSYPVSQDIQSPSFSYGVSVYEGLYWITLGDLETRICNAHTYKFTPALDSLFISLPTGVL